MTTETTRPWARFFARFIDYLIISLLIAFSDFSYLAIVMPFIWIPIEGKLLSTWGYTPGKWIFAISVRKEGGKLLSFKEATKRAWRVVLEGLYLAIPIISIIGLINAYIQLTHKGITEWDKDGGYVLKRSRE